MAQRSLLPHLIPLLMLTVVTCDEPISYTFWTSPLYGERSMRGINATKTTNVQPLTKQPQSNYTMITTTVKNVKNPETKIPDYTKVKAATYFTESTKNKATTKIKNPSVSSISTASLPSSTATTAPYTSSLSTSSLKLSTATTITTTDDATTKSQTTIQTTDVTKMEDRTNPVTNKVEDDDNTRSTAPVLNNKVTYYHQKLKPMVKIPVQSFTTPQQNLLPLPAGAGAALVKPTRYHYYPHNQHIYLLPECAIQQVCNAVYVRLNFTQPLCACSSRYRDPCSASLNSDDQHTTELINDPNGKRALTLVKTCEPTNEMRECKAPRDWSLLALQNIRTGKSHYLIICRCPENNILEGPISHDQPAYASIPGIRVFGMMCVQTYRRRNRMTRTLRQSRSIAVKGKTPAFPWHKIDELNRHAVWV